MVIILQLCLFFIAVLWRGRYLFGAHLKPSKANAEWLTYTEKNKQGIKGRQIGINRHEGISFIVKTERWYHRILKNIGIASEVAISNPEFNKKFFITTDYPSHLEQALASGKLLVHLQDLFALPVKSLHATPKKIWCVMKNNALATDDAHYTTHYQLLEAISKDSSRSESNGYVAAGAQKLSYIALICICFHAGLLMLGLFGGVTTLADTIETIEKNELITKGIVFGAIGVVAWLFIIINIFKNSSWICWVLADLVLCGIIGFVFSGIVVTREANIHLTQPPPLIFNKKIVDKSCTLKCSKSCGRRCTRYSSYSYATDSECLPRLREAIMAEKIRTDYICTANAHFEYSMEVQHWRKEGLYSFKPMVSLFDSVSTGDLVYIPVNEGALGLEWVDTNEIQGR